MTSCINDDNTMSGFWTNDKTQTKLYKVYSLQYSTGKGHHLDTMEAKTIIIEQLSDDHKESGSMLAHNIVGWLAGKNSKNEKNKKDSKGGGGGKRKQSWPPSDQRAYTLTLKTRKRSFLSFPIISKDQTLKVTEHAHTHTLKMYFEWCSSSEEHVWRWSRKRCKRVCYVNSRDLDDGKESPIVSINTEHNRMWRRKSRTKVNVIKNLKMTKEDNGLTSTHTHTIGILKLSSCRGQRYPHTQ